MPVAPSVTVAIAAFAAASSAVAYRLARQALRMQMPRAAGALSAHIAEGRARRTLADDGREYALRVDVRNSSPIACPITNIRLRVTYLTRANFLGIVDLEPSSDTPVDGTSDDRLALPLTLAAGTSAAGWLFFRTSNVIPRHCRVDDYTLLLMTADGRRVKVDAALPAILAADTDGTGPATWGWD